jgi:AcrR family transcriptional regulator
MPPRTRSRKEPGRDAILVAGRELFAERGFNAASVSEIAARAGIAKSVIYHHFGSKAGLYEAIVQAETGELLDRVAAALPAKSADAPRLRPGLDAYLGFLEQNPAAWRLLLRDAPVDPELVKVDDRLRRNRSEALGALLAGTDTDSRRSAEKALHADLLTTGIRAFAAWWYEHREIPREQVLEAILAFSDAGRDMITARRKVRKSR